MPESDFGRDDLRGTFGVKGPCTVISHDSGTITTFSILPRANELLRVPQPVFPDRTGTGSIPAKRFL